MAAWQNLGFANYFARQFDKAVEAFVHAQKLAPDDAITNNLGFAHVFADRYPDAISSFQNALRIDPKLVTAINGLCSRWRSIKKCSTLLIPV